MDERVSSLLKHLALNPFLSDLSIHLVIKFEIVNPLTLIDTVTDTLVNKRKLLLLA